MEAWSGLKKEHLMVLKSGAKKGLSMLEFKSESKTELSKGGRKSVVKKELSMVK